MKVVSNKTIPIPIQNERHSSKKTLNASSAALATLSCISSICSLGIAPAAQIGISGAICLTNLLAHAIPTPSEPSQKRTFVVKAIKILQKSSPLLTHSATAVIAATSLYFGAPVFGFAGLALLISSVSLLAHAVIANNKTRNDSSVENDLPENKDAEKKDKSPLITKCILKEELPSSYKLPIIEETPLTTEEIFRKELPFPDGLPVIEETPLTTEEIFKKELPFPDGFPIEERPSATDSHPPVKKPSDSRIKKSIKCLLPLICFEVLGPKVAFGIRNIKSGVTSIYKKRKINRANTALIVIGTSHLILAGTQVLISKNLSHEKMNDSIKDEKSFQQYCQRRSKGKLKGLILKQLA